MATLYLRNVPDEVIGAIRDLARDEGRSVNAQVVRMLAEAVEARLCSSSVSNIVSRARSIRRSVRRPRGLPDSVELIRTSREGRDR